MSRGISIPDTTYVKDLKERVADTQKTVEDLKQKLSYMKYEELPKLISQRIQVSESLRQRLGGNDEDILIQERARLAVVISQLGKEKCRFGERLAGYVSVLNTLSLELEITEANTNIQGWFR